MITPLGFINDILAWRRKTIQTLQIPLSAPGVNLSTATKKARVRPPHAQTLNVVGFAVDCDPADKPSAAHAQFDLKIENASTGAETSVLSAIAQISTGTYSGTGTLAGGKYLWAAGSTLCIDVAQGSDGKGYVATISYYPVI